jgi:hypothetical protein
LQLLLAGAPSGILNEGGADPTSLDLLLLDSGNVLFAGELSGLENTAVQVPSGSTAPLPLVSLVSAPASDADPTVAIASPGCPLAPAFAAMMALVQIAPGAGETSNYGAAVLAADSPTVTQNDGVAAVRVAGKIPASDLLSWSDILHGAGELPTSQLPLIAEPASCASDSPDGADKATQILVDCSITQTAAQLVGTVLSAQSGEQSVGKALPAQPGGLLVTDALVTQTDARLTEAVATPPETENPPPPVDGGSGPALDTICLTGKSLPSKPGNESVRDHFNPPIPPSGDDSPFIAKPSVLLPESSPAPDPTSESAAAALRAKSPDTAGTPDVSSEARDLASKMTDLGLQSLSVRVGKPQSKLTGRLESLPTGGESAASAPATREMDALAATALQPSRDPSIERGSSPDDPDRKRGERVAATETRSTSEAPQKQSAGLDQESSGRPVIASKETVTGRTESPSTVRYMVEEQKPVRVPGQITVRLEPPELGRLTIDLVAGSSGIIGRLRFASDAVRTVVERDIAQLHRSLADAGVRVERLDVVGAAAAGERSSLSSQTSGEYQPSQRQSQEHGRQNAPKDNPWHTGSERGDHSNPLWLEQRTSPWVAMTSPAQGLNLVA